MKNFITDLIGALCVFALPVLMLFWMHVLWG
jgi:hypothetical protein